MTRRGMLSIFRSIYDKLGFLAPFILKDKRLLQLLFQDEIGWDESVDDSIINELLLWKISLEGHEIIWCFKPSGFGKIKEFWLHNFSDASEEGYGRVSYLRMVNMDERIHCCFLVGKARVTPNNFVSIPRLKLVAAVLSAKVENFLKKESEIAAFMKHIDPIVKLCLGP